MGLRKSIIMGIKTNPLPQRCLSIQHVYEIFGKYVIPFLANPAKIPYGYIQKDGSMVIYPFTPSGLFNNKEYYKGLFYYQKYKGKGNVSKQYWDKISNIYIYKNDIHDTRKVEYMY